MDLKNQSKLVTFPHKQKRSRKIILFFLLLFFLVGSFFLGFEKGKEEGNMESNQEIPLVESFVTNKLYGENQTLDFSLFWKVWDLLKEKHIDRNTFDAKTLMYGAIKGMLQATEDPYTNFFDPKETKSFNEELNGSFEGIGSELGIKDNLLTIIAPLPDSPSEKAGLRAGDRIIKIDGQSTNDMSTDKAVELIRGKKDTQVTLTIFREGEEQTREISITRDVIHLDSLSFQFKENNIVYVKINTFSEDTTREFRKFSSEVLSKNSPGIILDLRNNPGGLVDKCVEIAGFLLERNSPVVIEENYKGTRQELRTTGGGSLSHLPIVVLINEGSASASEILAGALRDNRRITLIGKKSFGKGSVQEYLTLPENTSTKITIAKWLTPNGEYIMEKGITPEIEIDYSLENFKNNYDPQLEKALSTIKEKLIQN